MAIKLVKYNGGTATYKYCSSPKVLEKGKIYEVIARDVYDCQTNYYLKGVDGYFNSVWFDDVHIQLVTSTHIPKLNERFLCYKLEPNGDKYIRIELLTSPVKEIQTISNKAYLIHTVNSCYIVSVL